MADFSDVLFHAADDELVLGPPDDVTAYFDPVAPIVSFSPPSGTIAPSGSVQIEAADERVLELLTVVHDDRVVYTGDSFASQYSLSEEQPLFRGKRLIVRRNAGWPASFTLTALALDQGGNAVRITAQYGAEAAPTSISATVRRDSRQPVSDVHLTHTPDGGEISFASGQAVLSDGLESSIYLSLFGGNERDSGRAADERFQWWGNLGERDLAKQYRSETQYLVRSLPATTGNLRRVEDAVKHDLDWLTATSLATSIKVTVGIPKLNTIAIAVTVDLASGETPRFEFRQSWGART
jgi:phage gp46-like protein